MFRRHYRRRSTNILFVIFRLGLSVVMFTVLLAGIYSAYKHFSGLDPLKLDPQAAFNQVLGLLPVGRQVLSRQFRLPVSQPGQPNQEQTGSPALLFRFLLIADSHNDNANLKKAINQAKAKYPDLKFIIGLGDYSDVGTIDELSSAKAVFDSSSLRYFLIPGDHDLWDCRNRSLPPTSCFQEVFGPTYQSFAFDNFKFLLLDNSDNYKGFDTEQLEWITQELEKAKEEGTKGVLVFVHTPLYHPSSDHVMGWVEKKLKLQAEQMLFQLKDTGITKKVFAGDIHYFSQTSEPKTALPMVTIGAVTPERNPQAPRFGVVSVFEDGSTAVEDVIIL